MSLGMNARTGRSIEDIAHIQQSIRDILTTPIGSRLMRRDYGSLLSELIDQPLNGATLLRAYSATVMALMKWEPRIKITQLYFETTSSHAVMLHIDGEYLSDTSKHNSAQFTPRRFEVALKDSKP
jgi:phage baseplate assembly protein W